MEPPRKKQRHSRSNVPDADLQKRRARNDNRLKSIFESIFDKYGKDFNGIGDEIDLRTGEIVVNNGHLLGMTNERDAGQAESTLGKIDSEYSSEGEEEEGENPDEGDAALVTESQNGLQKLYSVDYLMQDTDTEPLSTTFGRSLHGQIIDYGSEEDELADHAIEWVTPREARAIAHQKWQLPDDGLTFTDESSVEEAWRVPPLPKLTAPCSSMQKVVPISDHVREPLDLEESGISLQASAERECRHSRLAEPPRLHQPASPSPSSEGPRISLWTKEEEDLLRHLKDSTTMTYKEMDSCFPKRTLNSVATKWTQMVNCGKASRTVNKEVRRKPRPTSSTEPCHVGPTCEGDHEDDEQLLHERQQSSEADVSCDHPTKTFASELSSLVQGSVDSYLKPHPQHVDTSWLSGDYSELDQTLSRDFSPAITDTQNLLEELQRGFRVRYPSASHSDQIDRTIQASPPPVPAHHPDYRSGHAETGGYVQGNRHPSISNHPQPHDAASSPPWYSHGVEDDAAIRRRVCIDQIAKYAHVIASQEVEDYAAMRRRVCSDQIADYGHAIDPEGDPLPRAESGEQVNQYEPVLDSLADVFPVLDSSDPHRPEVAILVPAQPKERPLGTPALIQQVDSFSFPSAMSTPEVTHSLSSPVHSGRVTKAIGAPLATLSGVEHVVQVLIPKLNSYQVCKPTDPLSSGLAEETLIFPTLEVAQSQPEMVMPVFCGPRGGSSQPGEAPLNSEAVYDVEIPDSQPEFSSSIILDNENAEPTLTNAQSSSKASPLARQISVQPNNLPLANIKFLRSEFDDELSTVTLRPKRQLGTLATTSVITPQGSKAVTPLTRQARKKRDSKVTKTTMDDSLPLGMLDCSDDELSFP